MSKKIDLLPEGSKINNDTLLTFSLDREEYGIAILKVREIIGLMLITSVPKASKSIKGVINLRGKVIPVVDLRTCFGLPDVESSERTCIIVVELTGREETDTLCGIIVDAVSEVLSIKESDIEDVGSLGGHLDSGFILGMAKDGDRLRMLLDIDKVLDAENIDRLAA